MVCARSHALRQILAVSFLTALHPAVARSDCPEAPIPVPNVAWVVRDSVTACPAGDSVTFTHSPSHQHPSRLRMAITYQDDNCNPRGGIPNDSIWVTSSVLQGNPKFNDQGPTFYADLPTNPVGQTWILFPSFSGCGKMRFHLYVSGVHQGYRDVVLRSTDFDASGHVDGGDLGPGQQCDLNWDGVVTQSGDLSIASAHTSHWSRNALHGGLIGRTNVGATGGSLGASKVFWSPSGRYLSIGLHPPGPCAVFIATSDAASQGVTDTLRQVTFPTNFSQRDYDPCWSPLNHTITYTRGDTTLYAHSLIGFGGNGTTYVIHRHNDGDIPPRGVLTASISPDGQWVAFSRRDVATGPICLYKIPISGDQTRLVKLTDPTDAEDWYPVWSPDGTSIMFQRQAPPPHGSDPYNKVLRISAFGDSTQVPLEVYTNNQGKPSFYDAATPSYSPDGLVLLAGIGPRVADSVFTHTLDLSLSSKPRIPNYAESKYASKHFLTFPILSPNLSPDGTRLALASTNIYAARRNMNMPGRFTRITPDGESPVTINDTTVTYKIIAAPAHAVGFTLDAMDPEDDVLTYHAYSLGPGMTFDESTRHFSWTTPAIPGDYFVKFTVTQASGGTDVLLVDIQVLNPQVPGVVSLAASAPPEIQIDTPSSVRGRIVARIVGPPTLTARLNIYDLAGRRVAEVSAQAGSTLMWDGTGSSGVRVLPGLYVYRVRAGATSRHGKVIVVR